MVNYAFHCYILFAFFGLFISCSCTATALDGADRRKNGNNTESLFDQNYNVTWGQYHVKFLGKDRAVQLALDRSSGSGFASKGKYLFGNFSTRIKLVKGDSSGIVTAFYLTTQESSHHDEIDFEFLGGRRGKSYRVQTNVYVDGDGDREERMHLWFDPTEDFHSYSILWHPRQILFMVDNVPIRVFKNLQNVLGVPYPSFKPMQIVASLWNGEEWATEGGKRKINWSKSPFHVSFQGFDIKGCMCEANSSSCPISSIDSLACDPHTSQRTQLYLAKSLKHVREHYITYTYCHDMSRFLKTPPECQENIL